MVRDLGTVQFQAVFDQAGAPLRRGSETANWIAFPAARRRRRQVGPDPAPHLAPRRYGGPDAGLGADPRGDDGDGRRLSGRAHPPAVRERARHPRSRGADRRRHAAHGRSDRRRPDRHQTHHRLLDHEPDRLHVRRRRSRRVLVGHGPPADARLLQGPALPRRRHRDPRAERRAGRAPDGRAPQRPPAHDGPHVDRDDRAHRLLAHLEGRHPGGRLREGRNARDDRLGGRPHRGVLHGRLRGAAHAAHVLRPEVDVRRRPPPRHVARRGAGDDVLDGDGARRRRDPVGFLAIGFGAHDLLADWLQFVAPTIDVDRG